MIAVLVPKLRDDAGDGAIQAGDDGADADDGPGADDHAQNGKERAHFVLAHGGERQPDRGGEFNRESFARRHRSTLRASIGSSLEACCAG